MRRLATLLALLLAACRTGRDYPAATAPRYAGLPPQLRTPATVPDTLRVVTFNIEFARRVDDAVTLLSTHPALKDADVVLLQEMHAEGTRYIADALGMAYVYYPAIYHNRAKQDFGNAVLSRWPIEEDARLALPHPSRYAGTHRIAVAATLRVGPHRVRAYSTHLGTPLDIGDRRRRAQLEAILADAARYPLVVVGGDMNDGSVAAAAERAGYAWPTRRVPKSSALGRFDHVLFRGMASPGSGSAGTVADGPRVGDHRPVWAVAALR